MGPKKRRQRETEEFERGRVELEEMAKEEMEKENGGKETGTPEIEELESIVIKEGKKTFIEKIKEITANSLVDIKSKAKYLQCLVKVDSTVGESEPEVYNPEPLPVQKTAKELLDRIREDSKTPSPFYAANLEMRNWTEGIM